MAERLIYWLGTSRKDLRAFPDLVRQKAGFQLRAIQSGSQPSDFRPMPVIGKGVEEIRIQVEGAYRVFYVAKFDEAIYVLHVFQKKTQKTSKVDLQIGQQRYQQMQEFRENLASEAENGK